MPSTDAQLKLGRAAEHIATVRTLVNAWLEGPDLKIEQIRGADDHTEARVRLRGSPPPGIAIVVGEAVHSLRSALDNAVYASARAAAGGTLDEKTERALEFAVVGPGTQVDFDAAANWKLSGVPDAVCMVVEDDQPYRWTTEEHPDGYRFHPVWLVHDLDRIDKHRRLALTAAAVRHAAVGIPEGVEPEVKFFHLHGPVVDGQLIASYLGSHLGVEFLYDLGVTLVDGPASITGATVAETLDSLFNHVAWMVTRIEFVQ
jgi:hypothetical protein